MTAVQVLAVFAASVALAYLPFVVARRRSAWCPGCPHRAVDHHSLPGSPTRCWGAGTVDDDTGSPVWPIETVCRCARPVDR